MRIDGHVASQLVAVSPQRSGGSRVPQNCMHGGALPSQPGGHVGPRDRLDGGRSRESR